jgi:mitosis inhibitor protein kinase SWE1
MTFWILFCRGDAWHQLRQEDFSQIDLDGSPELLALIKNMMRTNPAQRVDMRAICAHPVISRARSEMARTFAQAKASGSSLFAASPLAGVPDNFLETILGHAMGIIPDDGAMDLSP